MRIYAPKNQMKAKNRVIIRSSAQIGEREREMRTSVIALALDHLAEQSAGGANKMRLAPLGLGLGSVPDTNLEPSPMVHLLAAAQAHLDTINKGKSEETHRSMGCLRLGFWPSVPRTTSWEDRRVSSTSRVTMGRHVFSGRRKWRFCVRTTVGEESEMV